MDTMRIGIECLLADDMQTAMPLALQLDELNKERRRVEAGMQDQAMALIAANTSLAFDAAAQTKSIVLYEPSWHQGVIGIVAGRLKEYFHRPSIVFAPSDESKQLLKGSARSIPGIHIRDAIEMVAEENPRLISYFGGMPWQQG